MWGYGGTGADAEALTFLCSIADDDLSASFAGLLHRECRAQALLVLSEALAFFEAVLLHDLVGHCTSAQTQNIQTTIFKLRQ